MIVAIIEQYPEFRAYYEQIYDICRNIEGVMDMFSKELQELDRNTVQLMIDEMQEDLKQKGKELDLINQKLGEKNQELDEKNQELNEKNQKLNEKVRNWMKKGIPSSPQVLQDEIVGMNIFNSVFVDCTASPEIAGLYKEFFKSQYFGCSSQ